MDRHDEPGREDHPTPPGEQFDPAMSADDDVNAFAERMEKSIQQVLPEIERGFNKPKR